MICNVLAGLAGDNDAMLSVLLSILSFTAHCRSTSQVNPTRVVDLGYATYESNLSILEGVTSFLGIRYAAPPTGNFRWREPQVPQTVTGVQPAMAQPSQCFQEFITGAAGTSTTSPFRKKRTSSKSRTTTAKPRKARKVKSVKVRDSDGVSNEDCLFLNVHTPTVPQNELLPVIVYMHGGGYDAGNVTLYPVEDFVRDSNFSLVSVSIQYRLGIWGFLSGQKVKDNGALNAGLLDQNFALQWVQKHIASFGGDPTKVTIYGQSAGAGSMLQHLVAHAGNTQPPLFRAVMMNSPFLPFQYDYNDPITEMLYSEVVSSVSCSEEEDTLSCLRDVDASDLLIADTNIGHSNFMGTYTFVPVVDGMFIVERPSVTFKRGKVNGNTLIVSTNSDEGLMFLTPSVLMTQNFTSEEYVSQLFPRMSEEQIQNTVALYSSLGFTNVTDLAAAVMGDSIFVCPAHYALSAFGSRGWKSELAIPPGTHALDLAFDFSTFALPPAFNNSEFSMAWEQSFLSTAVALDPNNGSIETITPQWPSYAPSNVEMLFNKTVDDKPVVHTVQTSPDQIRRCSLWESMTAVNSQ